MPRPTVDIEQKLPEIRALLEEYKGLPSQTADRKGYAMLTRYLKKYSEHPEVIKLIDEYEINFNGRRTRNDIDTIIEELREILEKYNGIPSQTVDRVAYARVKYYAKRHADNPSIKALLEEFNVNIGEGKGLDFVTFYNKIKTELEIEGRIPAVKDNQTLYSSVKYFFKKFARNPEVEKLKWIYAHSSCYPLAQSKENRPEFQTNAIYIGCVPAYTQWKHDASLEYILYVFQKYKELPAPNSKPMEELKYTINKWYRYQDRGKENLKNYLATLIDLGCQEPFILEAYETFDFDSEENISNINKLLIEHGACTIHYLAHKVKPGKVYPEEFVLYYFYNMMNDTPEYRKINGLGELFYSSDGSTPIYVHYRLLNQCDVEKIRNRVKNNPRNWKENPPETIEEWEQYGEYRFFIPSPRSDWSCEAYDNFDLSFPEKAIENGHPYFRYYKSGLRYLDYKLFLQENGLILKNLRGSHELNYISTKSLAENTSFNSNEDRYAAFLLAKEDPECHIDSDGGVYIKSENGLQLIYAPLGVKFYEVDKETIKISKNSFWPCKESLQNLKLGHKLLKYEDRFSSGIERIIIPAEKLSDYCQILPKNLSKKFYDYNEHKLKIEPIIKENILIWVPILNKYEVPNSVNCISSMAFKGSMLQELIICGEIKKIESELNLGSSLKRLELKEGVKSIWGSAFAYCDNLEEVILPESLESLYNTFEGCKSLELIQLGKNINYIGYHTFKNCENLSEVTIDGHLSTLDMSAFSGCKSIKTLRIPNGIDNLTGALDNCDSLESIIFEGQYKYFGYRALEFHDCPNLQAIYVSSENYDFFMDNIPDLYKHLLKIYKGDN